MVILLDGPMLYFSLVILSIRERPIVNLLDISNPSFFSFPMWWFLLSQLSMVIFLDDLFSSSQRTMNVVLDGLIPFVPRNKDYSANKLTTPVSKQHFLNLEYRRGLAHLYQLLDPPLIEIKSSSNPKTRNIKTNQNE